MLQDSGYHLCDRGWLRASVLDATVPVASPLQFQSCGYLVGHPLHGKRRQWFVLASPRRSQGPDPYCSEDCHHGGVAISSALTVTPYEGRRWESSVGPADNNSAALGRPPITRALLYLPTVSNSKVQRSPAGFSRPNKSRDPPNASQLRVSYSYNGWRAFLTVGGIAGVGHAGVASRRTRRDFSDATPSRTHFV